MAIIVNRNHYYNKNVYTVDLHGTDIAVTVTAVPSVVRKWLNHTLYLRRRYVLRHRLVVGLGVQWTPGGQDPPTDILQLCIGRRCLIFQLSHADSVPSSLRRLLRNPDITFVGFWNNSDRQKLESSVHRLEMYQDPLDLRLYAETENDKEYLGRATVDEIVYKCLGFKVEQRREISRSDWSEMYLSEDQVAYACVDAYCAFLLGKNIKAWQY